MDMCEKRGVVRVLAFAAEMCAALAGAGVSAAAAVGCAREACAAYGFRGASFSLLACHVRASAGAACVLVRVRRRGCDFGIAEDCRAIVRLCLCGAPLCRAERLFRAALHRPRHGAASTGGGLACAAFCALFGGAVAECAVCMAAGTAAHALSRAVKFPFLRAVVPPAVGATVCLLSCSALLCFGVDCRAAYAAAGCVMISVPGILLWRAFADIFSGGALFGALSAVRAAACFFAVAFAYVAAGAFFCFLPQTDFYSPPPSPIVCCLLCGAGAAGFCAAFNARPMCTACGGALASVCFAVYSALSARNVFVACFAAAAAGRVLSAALSRAAAPPADVFFISAAVPLVPGAPLFYCLCFLIAGKFCFAAAYAADAFVFYSAVLCGEALVRLAARARRALCRHAFRRPFCGKKLKLPSKKRYLFGMRVL